MIRERSEHNLVRSRQRAWRWSACFLVATSGACSLSSPTYKDYEGTRSATGGSDSGSAGANAGSSDTSAGSGAASNSGAAGVPTEAGAAGELETPDAPAVPAQPVLASDIVLDPVVSYGLPSFAAISDSSVEEAGATAAQVPPPLFKPYNSKDKAWWDNLVAEQTQARMPLVVLPTRGVYTLDPADTGGPGNQNPRRLKAWTDAIERTSDKSLFQAICLVDTPFLPIVASKLHGNAVLAPIDLSLQSDWNDVFWARAIKPWFDTVAKPYWYTRNGGAWIAFGPVSASSVTKTSGNLSKMLSALAASFKTAYGMPLWFLLDSSWFDADLTLSTNPLVAGRNPWLTPSTVAFAFSSYQGLTAGTVVPGFRSPTLTLERETTDTYGNPIVTLINGLSASLTRKSQLTLLQGFTNLSAGEGFYRSDAWGNPNQYINLVRRYADPRTEALRLEAEGCDRYSDTTPGNSGGVFRRDGDLDVRGLSSGVGWAVTNTAAGEWIEFDAVDFSAGEYQFAAQYSTSSGAATPSVDKRLELVIDGQKLTPVIVPSTVNVDDFHAIVLGTQTLDHGPHQLRLRVLDGLVDLDWLFVRKISPHFGVRVSAGTYMSAPEGGGTTLNARGKTAFIFEQFTFDDVNGGELEDGDQVYIQTYNGMYVTFSASAKSIFANQRSPHANEKFTIHVLGGGQVRVGSRVALEAPDQAHYLTATTANDIDGSGTAIGDAQTYTLVDD